MGGDVTIDSRPGRTSVALSLRLDTAGEREQEREAVST
jgi:hypothetical protein